MKQPTARQYLVDAKGHKRAIVIDMDTYEKMIEDISDLKIVAERRDNPKMRSLQFLSRLKKNGIL